MKLKNQSNITKEINEFLSFKKRMSLKEGTLVIYRQTLNEFLKFLLEDEPDVNDIIDITQDTILAYEKYLTTKIDLRGKILSHNQRRRYLTSVKLFFQHLSKQDKIYRDPAVNISMPKIKKPVVKDILTIEEMDGLLKKISGHSMKSLRDRAILELLYSTGIRSNELCNIHIEDVGLAERTLYVRKGKYDGERYLPFGEPALYWLTRYMEKARPLICENDSGVLFVSLYGRKLSPHTLREIILYCMRKAKLERKITSHTFRHSCATHMLKGGADIRYVQMQLGHRNLATTQKYLKIEITDLKEIHERCHPREQEDW